MFTRVFVESDVANHPRTQSILNHFSHLPISEIQNYKDVFEKVKKPYLQKRNNLNLFIAKKEGVLLKEAPDAYGYGTEPHYYFHNAYNCIYECEYCYLQGYFHSPDLVMFINHEDISAEMEKLISKHKNKTVWFHAGEFSDSLALSHISGELPYYFNFFNGKNAKLELRTKSANIKPLLDLESLKNIVISFSLSPDNALKKYDRKTPPLKTRLLAIEKLVHKGFQIGLHFDPVVYTPNYVNEYHELFQALKEILPQEQCEYISLGVVRFPENIYKQVLNNYPDSDIMSNEFIKSFDNKIRYPRPMRSEILNTLKSMLPYSQDKSYLCME